MYIYKLLKFHWFVDLHRFGATITAQGQKYGTSRALYLDMASFIELVVHLRHHVTH